MAFSSVLHALQNRSPRSRNRKERQKEIALSKYAPLVKYVVDRLALHLPKSVERDDLTSAAIIGLFDALEKFDASKGTKFETYAIWRIRGAILDELRSLDWASRSIRRKARTVEEAARELGQKLGRAATEEEVADALNLSPVELSRLMDEVHGTALLSLSKAVSTEDDQDYIQLEDIVDDPAQADALEVIESEQAREVLLETIDGLPEQQRLVVALYYYEEMTLKEIGEALHISESRVSQIHTRAVKTLKARLARVL
ncbi:MAG TPA: FliA/WhiG family RNA polymerase sigma factor [Candidatus Omnitrophota bacterium]|jgi:RNA polymerase sigma factor for flagellar operon FliA|nr:FliA/WhiG family RNA polymerase sigma factor [Candidatus Eisenbacteria bacterium]HEU4765583.1 FliA/WhiG family RNA polymerase sigma factor [Candidatus Eisenbacteria bacterium]HTL99807.1 FliA/WhiG family RNA polymerase sigma factor [Candidatus Omnitrophota bacterium]